MNIKYKTYTLTQQESGFDLVETVQSQKIGEGTLQKPTGELYDKEIPLGYNMRIDTCFHKIIHLELLKIKDTVELKEFRDEFKKLHDELTKLMQYENNLEISIKRN